MSTTIVGIDCAGQYPKFGLALGEISREGTKITKVTTGKAVGGGEEDVVRVITDWIRNKGASVLAFDAPLGWPCPLALGLGGHQAGASIVSGGEYDEGARQLFRRATDRFVWEKGGKKPLDVGADRIAWVAARALWLIGKLRKNGDDLPLLWQPETPARPGIIEVYPAATLRAHLGTPETPKPDLGYKGDKDTHRAARQQLTERLAGKTTERLAGKVPLDLGQASRDLMVQSDDALDAVICVLAAADFIRGEAYQPEDHKLAEKEGWIWLRKNAEAADESTR